MVWTFENVICLWGDTVGADKLDEHSEFFVILDDERCVLEYFEIHGYEIINKILEPLDTSGWQIGECSSTKGGVDGLYVRLIVSLFEEGRHEWLHQVDVGADGTFRECLNDQTEYFILEVNKFLFQNYHDIFEKFYYFVYQGVFIFIFLVSGVQENK